MDDIGFSNSRYFDDSVKDLTYSLDKNSTLIEYAVFFGSIQIVQFLLLQNVKIDNERLWIYAIHSNKTEMIHILESNQIILDEQAKEKIYLESIKCHHNKLTEYIENVLLNRKIDIINDENEDNEEIISTIFKYRNYLYYPEDFEKNYTFFYLCKYKYLKIANLYLDTKKIEAKITIELLQKLADENKLYAIYYLLKKQKKNHQKAFEKCQIIKFSIPPTIKRIRENSFNECTSLTELYIPSSVKIIESCAFYGCSSLTKIKIHESVTSIESCAFYGCSSLVKVKIPESVTSIGQQSFRECSSLQEINIPSLG